MTVEYSCPGCDNSVLVPGRAAAIIGRDEELGCNNTDEHETSEPLVMWPEDEQ